MARKNNFTTSKWNFSISGKEHLKYYGIWYLEKEQNDHIPDDCPGHTISELRKQIRNPMKLASWWLNQPSWKIWVKMGIFPKHRGENKIFETTIQN